MNRPQWMLVVFIGVVAVAAFIKADQLSRRFGSTNYIKPGSLTA